MNLLTNNSLSIQHFDTLNFDNVLNYHGIKGKLYNYQGYNDLYQLYKINQIFSSKPWGEIIDRSGLTPYPFKLHIRLPWTGPKKIMDLDQVCNVTVKNIVASQPAPYLIYWSGGIDSTLALVSFLREVDNKELIVYCSEASIEENPYFFSKYIKNKIKTIDSKGISPDIGTHITGDCGDTIWATLDDSFMQNDVTKKLLYKPWLETFTQHSNDTAFLNFCEEFMKKSGRAIDTLFEARWWFYFLTKSQGKAVYKMTSVLIDSANINLINFYENDFFDTWSYFNTDKIIKGYDWATYKWPAKEIIYKFDKNCDYYNNKSKGYSNHVIKHKVVKNLNINFKMPLFVTDNNERPQLPTEPFWSSDIYQELFFEKYKHLFYK